MAVRCSTYKHRYLYVTTILLAIALTITLFYRIGHSPITNVENVISQTIYNKIPATSARQKQCRLHSNECFNIYRCGYNEGNKIRVYIYPFTNYYNNDDEQLSPAISRDFHQLLSALKQSDYDTKNIEEACVIIPAIDTLNQRRINVGNVARILSSLPSWQKHGGKNHIIFNMLPGDTPDFNTVLDVATDKAMLAGGGFSTWSYRPGFDISIPVFNSLTNHLQTTFDQNAQQKWFLLSTQVNFNIQFRASLNALASVHSDIMITNRCLKDDHILTRCDGKSVYKYPQILQYASFCLVIRAARLGQSTLMDILMMQCIPVFVADDYVLPFSEVLDWKRASVIIREEQIPVIYSILKSFTTNEISGMKRQVKHLWMSYFSSMANIGLTTMRILNDRVFPNSAWSYERWNTPALTFSAKEKDITRPPFIIPLMSARKNGFTAIVLSYDRLSMLSRVLEQVDEVPSLVKIIVVWNNVNKSPPQAAELPKLSKPVKIIQTKSNKLSNRFYPYNEIETEAVFSIDDDIVMLTTDEIQFGFEVWSEFPDRLVGFPGRFHLSQNGTGELKYESEWVNEVSMVLTGAAFHHKFYNHAFTYMMPRDIRDWVDTHMNCEDIAMNFLVANLTEKAPIKVTPRKRFRCPECSVSDALGSDPKHFQERTACIRRFSQIYGRVPLKSSEFRADPVLFQEKISAKAKRFKNIGTI